MRYFVFLLCTASVVAHASETCGYVTKVQIDETGGQSIWMRNTRNTDDTVTLYEFDSISPSMFEAAKASVMANQYFCFERSANGYYKYSLEAR